MNLDHIPILDHHAHAIFHEAGWRTAPLESYFTEAYDPEVLKRHTPHGIFYRRSLRELAEFYSCEPERTAVDAARQAADYLDVARRMIREANIDTVLLDDGLFTGQLMSVAESDSLLPWQARRVLRLEAVLAGLVWQHDRVPDLLHSFESHLRQVAPTLAGLKSVIAYRTGLAVEKWDAGEVQAAYDALKRDLKTGETPKLTSKPLLDTALLLALRVARDVDLPVQFHTGYGDPDLDLRLANPLHLRSLFEDPDLRGLKIVMLHCYPFTREAGYLASVYPGAYLDLSLSIPFLSQHGMRTHVHEALHLSPLSKLLFATDASRTPELFYLGARWGRRMLGEVLDDTVRVGDLTANEAEEAAVMLLRGNASALYPAPVQLTAPTQAQA
ncbi:amidohydrolase family protein [Deinococcus detaillensis]|uniref:Amidohydrolase family protein n=1 Tax=Deinococcus detaillensis TaxID=2592048 RepID=A0A553UNL2_9DEIO|nr:amidohydrolase family protein [Deinococcus detaillensis]TSA81800.1 amidohydrolase family protein [Deinococcus detaillensis]